MFHLVSSGINNEYMQIFCYFSRRKNMCGNWGICHNYIEILLTGC